MKYIKIFENWTSARTWVNDEGILPNVVLIDGELSYNLRMLK
jgi:hypothetical protein